MFKNYISVSFQIRGMEVDGFGCVYTCISGRFTFEDIKPVIAKFVNDKYGQTVVPKDITITGVSEISRRLYKRLIK